MQFFKVMIRKNHLGLIIITLILGSFTPIVMTIPLVAYLFPQYNRTRGVLIGCSLLTLMTVASSLIHSIPCWGAWSYFTYSAVLIINITQLKKYPTLNLFSASTIYWIWTNFGTWVQTSMYSHNFYGLLQCYWMGLPFLKNMLLQSSYFLLLCPTHLKKSEFYHKTAILGCF